MKLEQAADIDCSASLNIFRHASKRTLSDLRDIGP
jgi:hypothetical protein